MANLVVRVSGDTATLACFLADLKTLAATLGVQVEDVGASVKTETKAEDDGYDRRPFSMP